MCFNIKSNFNRYKHVQSNLVIDGCPLLVPEVSILIPTFNRPKLLKEAVESALSQDFKYPYEVVIVDNDPVCNKEVDDLIASYLPANLRLYRNVENIGMFGNWNRCISLARGEYISILNDDDILSPSFLKMSYKKHTDAMIISTYAVFSDVPPVFEQYNDVTFKSLSLAELMNQTPVAGSLGVLMKKSLAEQLGGFNPDEWPTSDYWFAMRYFMKYGAIKTNKIMAGYRWLNNESLKETTINGFLKNDAMLRRQVIDSLDISCKKRNLLYLLTDLSSYLSKKYFDKFLDDFNKRDLTRKNINQCGRLNYFFRLIDKVKKYLWIVLIGKNYKFKG